uniref:Pleckstrin homology domain containing O2 n=1 Tax=Leptobrachium leishanense TaxID=445787 RepID=A0A8C5M5V6_9ANUR
MDLSGQETGSSWHQWTGCSVHFPDTGSRGVKGRRNSTPTSQIPIKAGWLKKSSGLLGLWKERYILLLQTQLLLCESEDEKKCLETLELASYERCQDQKAFLKRKRHFTLVPSPGTKVQDVKFLAKNAEERDIWIQALNDGINRGKNKILDEVKVDSSISLEHVTRDRVKVGGAKRRPPTRIHLKEVAEAAEDDSLRLGLDSLKTEALTVVPHIPKSVEPEPEPEPPKPTVKTALLPSKPRPRSSCEVQTSDTVDNDSQIPHPPSPPSKALKEGVYAKEKLLSEAEETKQGEGETGFKRSISGSLENLENNVKTPPKPPPKILSDKTKIKWLGSSSDLLDSERLQSEEKGSKQNLLEIESDEHGRSPSPARKVLVDAQEAPGLKHSMDSVDSEDQNVSNSPGDQHIEDEDNQGTMSTMAEEKELENDEDQKNETLGLKDFMEHSNVVPEREVQSPQVGEPVPGITCTLAASSFPVIKPRSSSMGDLLSDASMDDGSNNNRQSRKPLLPSKDHLREMELKLASGREKTETLLNRVLQGQFVKGLESNGPDVNAKLLLNEAVQQLREASQVLQELKETSVLSKMPEVITEKETEKQKELLTLYRRSLP